MPIHDLGYRNWEGEPSSQWLRWLVIAQTGIRLAWRSQWLRRMVFLAWIPAVGMGIVFFLYEQGLKNSSMENIRGFLSEVHPDLRREILPMLEADAAGARHYVWALLLLTFFLYPQGILMVMLVGIVAPPLISTDVRSRAFLLYFSRPINRVEYILGKATTVWAYLAAITTLPAIVLYLLGVLLSPDVSVVLDTWDLPFRVFAASFVVMIPTTAIALCFSSMTPESRYAGFAWFALWILGTVAYGFLTAIEIDSFTLPTRWRFVSLYHTLMAVESWIFGVSSSYTATEIATSALILIGVTVVALLVLLRNVSSPMRV